MHVKRGDKRNWRFKEAGSPCASWTTFVCCEESTTRGAKRQPKKRSKECATPSSEKLTRVQLRQRKKRAAAVRVAAARRFKHSCTCGRCKTCGCAEEPTTTRAQQRVRKRAQKRVTKSTEKPE